MVDVYFVNKRSLLFKKIDALKSVCMAEVGKSKPDNT